MIQNLYQGIFNHFLLFLCFWRTSSHRKLLDATIQRVNRCNNSEPLSRLMLTLSWYFLVSEKPLLTGSCWTLHYRKLKDAIIQNLYQGLYWQCLGISLFLKNIFSQEVAGRDNTERRRRQILLDRIRLLGSQDSSGIKHNDIRILGRRLKKQKDGKKWKKKDE